MNIPMSLTLLRLASIPLIIIFFYIPTEWSHIMTAIIFMIAGITDWLDGYFARKLKQTSKFGAFLDPVVDKLVVVSALLLLVSNPNFHLITVPALIITGREIIVSALREWMAELGKRTSVAVSYISKIKTALQIIAIIFLLASNPTQPNWILYNGYLLLYAAAILTLWTMFLYLKISWSDLNSW